MTEKIDIIRRIKMGQSIRAIHRETGIHRTIIRKLRRIALDRDWLIDGSHLPSESEMQHALIDDNDSITKAAHSLDQFKDKIKQWHESGYSFVVIHKLVNDYYKCSEATVRRYIQKYLPTIKKPVMVRPTVPGEIMEVDFGYLGITYDYKTKHNRKTYLFSGRLRHSRHTYRERVFSQKQDVFFACHIHAFEYFGGVPQKVVPDNLKAAVIKASVEDPHINHVYQDLAQYYGFLISPCKPYKPEHKGGVENDIRYVKKNFWPLFKEQEKMKGHTVPHAEELSVALEKWNKEIADVRIIRGVGKRPCDLFESEEKKVLLPLPYPRWDPVTISQAKVQETWRIQFQSSFYSVPYKYIGETVTVMANSTSVYIFLAHQEIASHPRAMRKWEYKRKKEHAPPEPEEYMSATKESILYSAQRIGTSVYYVVKALFTRKDVDGLRPARALMALRKKYGDMRLSRACSRALLYDNPEYRSVKLILENGLDKLDKEYPVDAVGQKMFRFARMPGYFAVTKNYEEVQNE